MLRAALGAIDLRCRIGARGVRIELGGDGLAEFLSPRNRRSGRPVEATVADSGHPFLGYGPYRRGSAFLRAGAMPDLGINPDWQRQARVGIGEAVFCAGKTAAQIAALVALAEERHASLLLTRLDRARFAELDDAYPQPARLRLPLADRGARQRPAERLSPAASASSAPGPPTWPWRPRRSVTLAFHGVASPLIADVGVAGLWRLLDRIAEIATWRVAIVVAGMEGALFGVVAGLVPGVVIAVPTSVGYGVAAGGMVALNAALASCAPGVVVVNIDNGFGAACAALKLLRVFAST